MIRLFIADVSGLDIDACLASVSPQRREKTLRLKMMTISAAVSVSSFCLKKPRDAATTL